MNFRRLAQCSVTESLSSERIASPPTLRSPCRPKDEAPSVVAAKEDGKMKGGHPFPIVFITDAAYRAYGVKSISKLDNSREGAHAMPDNIFIGTLTGQDYKNNVTVSVHAGSPPPGTVQPIPPPTIGPGTLTVTIDGENSQIKVGGGNKAGSLQLLNAVGKVVAVFDAEQSGISLYTAAGAFGPLNSLAAQLQSNPDGNLTLTNGAGVNAIRLIGKGASGWFGAPGVDGDVLVFGAGAKGTAAANAAVWIKGSTGDIVLQNADCAEEFEVQDSGGIEPGVVLTLTGQGKLALANRPYDRKVAGVVSGAGGLRPGIVLGRSADAQNRWPIALSGKAFCKVDADRSPVAVGDLLTTSPTPGHAMTARDHRRAFGAVIGKALAPLRSGQGMVPVLIALQ